MPAKVVCGVALMLVGCAVGPKYERSPTALPQNWSTEPAPAPPPSEAAPAPSPPAPEAGQAPPAPPPEPQTEITTSTSTEGEWWKLFGDPTLDKLVELADQQNLSLQVAGLRMAEARAQLRIAKNEQLPQRQVLYASATAIDIGDIPLGTVIDNTFVDYQVGFDATWEIDLWGKYRRGVEAGTENELASANDYHFARISVTAETARAYMMIRTFEVLIDLALESTRIQEEGLKIAESRARHGATSQLDVAQQRALLESTRATVPHLQIGLTQSRNALSLLLGQPPDGLDALLAGPRQIPTAPATVAVGVPADILRRRPDVLSAEHEATAQSARVGVAESDMYPLFEITGQIGFETTSGTGAPFQAEDALFYNAGPRLSWNFWDWGRTRNSVRVEDARYQQLVVGYQDTVLRAAREVDDALTTLTNSENASVSEQAAVDAARQALDISSTQYREGAVDFQRVLDAQRALLEQQNTLAQTRSDVATSLIALYKALGGGWETRPDQAPVNPAAEAQMKDRTRWGDLLSEPAEKEGVDDGE
jgi:NodT family efflux transporter outer membrane factor (OMF) lipoprotein